MKYLPFLAAALQGAAAFPAVLEGLTERATTGAKGCKVRAACTNSAKVQISNKKIGYDPNNPTAAQKLSAARNNCGVAHTCLVFNEADQAVSITGQNAYASPDASQIRGPCPGLNAAANHGYLPRSGVASIAETVTGLGALYNMSPDLGGFLAVYSIAIDGDPITMTWSIGGPQGALISNPQGISWSHNKYEGDSSIGRCDAYLNDGDAHSLSVDHYANAYAEGMKKDSYTMDVFSRAFTRNSERSVQTNPQFFAPLFSTTLVAPAAYNFVIAFMSNHSEASPGGYLNGAQFKQFFGITGDYPNFKWKKGQESIPTNWYRRPSTDQYDAADVFNDLIPEFLAYPKSFKFGGNVNGVNTYTGIDISNFTNGGANAATLFQGNNLQCFLYQNIQQGLPDVASTNPLGQAAFQLLLSGLGKLIGDITCPKAAQFNNNDLGKYPGRSYSPTAPAGNVNNC